MEHNNILDFQRMAKKNIYMKTASYNMSEFFLLVIYLHEENTVDNTIGLNITTTHVRDDKNNID